ncbi:melanophilin a [Brachionichthys hirsutus]|uniref:melanophilin a n=1 Tax=Brachionichthys hirsutus TaxID=412623 RepID=UPI0036053BB6
MERKLDLSRLTDEEAKHVWAVIQRDFNVRKTEEDRMGDLRTKIQKEDSKRELLGSQRHLSDSLCICCLQPFKFLVSSRRRCLDCEMFTCKSCSRYNKKEHGWVCDGCRMTRVLKMGTAGWYHDNVRNRFKRFGSAKVMRSLYKRLNADGGRGDDAQSMPDSHSYMYNGVEDDHGEDDGQRYRAMRKGKRLLSVHPLDFDPEDYFPRSRRASMQMQEDRGYRNSVDYDMYNHRVSRRSSLDRYAMRPDDYAESRMVRTRSLSKVGSSVARQIYVDTSDEDDYPRYPPMYAQPPYRRRHSQASLQEKPGQVKPINKLNKRMLAIESVLSRLEDKMMNASVTLSGQNEEEKLRKKLSELAGNLSDRVLSSDDERRVALDSVKDKDLSSSSNEMLTEAQKRSAAAALCDLTTEVLRTINATENAMVEFGLAEPLDRAHLVATVAKQADNAFRELEENVYMAAGKSYQLETKLKKLEQSSESCFGGTADSELSELEDVVALTTARVLTAESEVSDIESKIAALNAAGRKVSGSSKQKKSPLDSSKKRSHVPESLLGVQQKYHEATASNAQLRKDKSALMYQVEVLKEELSDEEEALWESRRRCDSISKGFIRASYGPHTGFNRASYGPHTGLIRASYGPHTGFIRASCGLHTGLIRASYGLHTGFIRASYGLHTGFIRASYGLHTGFIRASYGLHKGFIRASYGPHTGFIRASYGPHTGFIRASYGPHTGLIRASYGLHTGLIRASYGPHTGLIRASYGLHKGFIRASYGPHTGLIRASYGPHTGFIRASYGPHTGLIRASYGLHTGLIRASYGLHTGFIQASRGLPD